MSDLQLPMDIRKRDAELVLQHSGVLDWKEDVMYLRAQMTKEQPGSLAAFDARQKKKDLRKLKEKVNLEAKASKEKLTRAELEERKENIENEQVAEQQVDENDNDKSYTQGRSLIDVMGPISLTCDARNISVRDRTVVAASVVNALGPSLGITLDDTNVNKSTAWRKGQKKRLQKSKQIREEFTCPDRVVVHWDGKTLTLRGNVKSTRVCVYLSGVEAEQTRKLLGIPEAKSGRGEDEFGVVKEHLVKWEVREEVVGMVFDTTSSNTGETSGACRYGGEYCLTY